LRVLNTDPPYVPYNDSLGQDAFMFSFGVGKPIDPKIGFYSAAEVYFYYSKNETDSAGKPRRIKKKRNLDIAEC
jgi:hypothetical protein